MVHKTHVQNESVSPSMVQSVFGQLKANGYSESQIIALSRDLSVLAHECASAQGGEAVTVACQPAIDQMMFEVDLSGLSWIQHDQ